MFFLWILSVQFTFASQNSNLNCLFSNPGVIDAEFSILNRFEMQWNITKEDVFKHVELFSSRFQRGHELTRYDYDFMKMIGDGVAVYRKTSKKEFQYFISSGPPKDPTNSLRQAIRHLKKDYAIIKEVNYGGEEPIAGIYLSTRMLSLKGQLEAVNFVFGTKENSTLKIGHAFRNCTDIFYSVLAVKYLQRLNFISCDANPKNISSPEYSARNVIKACQELRVRAISINVTKDIRCTVSYPSYGTSGQEAAISLSNFQKFWCNIVQEIALNKSHPTIIMSSAFDYTPDDYTVNGLNLKQPVYHSGWWRRRISTSYEANAFVEKVEKLEGGREHENCTKECSYCRTNEECCDKRICYLDTMFQPYEDGTPKRVCQSISSKCAPRIPLSSASFLEITEPTTPFPLLKQSETGGLFSMPLSLIVFSVFALTVSITFVTFLVYKRGKPIQALGEKEIRSFFDGSASILADSYDAQLDTQRKVENLPYDNSLEVPKSAFEIHENEILGAGAFGVVVKGRIRDEEVAVKTVLPGINTVYLKALLLELKILMYLGSHESIVRFKGAYTAELMAGRLYLFMELSPLGNLLQFLRSRRYHFTDANAPENLVDENAGRLLTCKDLLQWSIQIAGALVHLTEKRVIHGDIAARNILVFSKDQVKLTDFGLSRRLYEYANYVENNQDPLPWRHLSLEALRDHNFSIWSDVWSFGVTMWEIFSLGKVPYPGHSLSQEFEKLLFEGLRPFQPELAHPLIYKIMTTCWEADVKSRPPIQSVYLQLSTALNDLFTISPVLWSPEIG